LKPVLEKCKRYDKFELFAVPVNPEEVPDYHTIIEKPMDFETMTKKLEDHKYLTFSQFEVIFVYVRMT
jgi:hypothetical protein